MFEKEFPGDFQKIFKRFLCSDELLKNFSNLCNAFHIRIEALMGKILPVNGLNVIIEVFVRVVWII